MDGSDRVFFLTPEHDTKIAGLYNIQHTIGRGHYAVVKLAQHVFTGEKVAVKVIDKTKLDCIARDHLFQEVVCMKLVQHPNVVRLYEVIDTPNKLYLILELGDGGDLYDYIMKHGRGLDERVAKRYFRQIVTAIAYCHKLHVVHRDLKPENVVFFEKLGLVKLTDFGFSNKFVPGTHLDTHCGSLAYSAPEILLGDPYDAPKVDVWSLGVILFMLVCGRLPFDEPNDSETLTKIMDCEYTIPSTVSPMCVSLIKNLLVIEPERRARLDDVLQDDWLRVEDHDLPIELFSVPLISREDLSFEDHMEILAKMSEGQLATVEEIQSTLDNDEYNHIAATFYLLAERKLKRNYIEEYKRLSHQAMLSENCKQLQPQPQVSQPQSTEVLVAGLTSTVSSSRSSATGITPAHEERIRRVSMILEDEEEEEKEEAVERVRIQQAKRQRLSSTNKSQSVSSWRCYGNDAAFVVLTNDVEETRNSVNGLDVYSSCCLVEPSQEALLAEEEEELVTVASLAMVRSDLLPEQASSTTTTTIASATSTIFTVNSRSTSVVSAVNAAGGVSLVPTSHTRPHSRGSISDGTESDLSLGNWSGYGASNITGSLHYVSPTARSLPATDARRRVTVYRCGTINHRPLVTVKSSPQLLKHILEEDRNTVSNVEGLSEENSVSRRISSEYKRQTSDQTSDSNATSIPDPLATQRGSNLSFDEQATRSQHPQLQRLSPLYLAQQRSKTLIGTEVSRSTTHSPSRTRRFFTSPLSAGHPSRPLSMGSWNLVGDFQRPSTSTSPVEPTNPLPMTAGATVLSRRRLNPVNHSHSISDRRCSGPPALMLALYNRYHSINLPPGATWSRLARSRSGSTSSCIGDGNRGVFDLSVSELEPAQNGDKDVLNVACPSVNNSFDSDVTLTIPSNHAVGCDSFDLLNGACSTTSTDPSAKGKVPTGDHGLLAKVGTSAASANNNNSHHIVLGSFASPHKAASWCSSTPLLCDDQPGLQGTGSDSVRHCATPPLSLPMAYPVSSIPLGLALREILCTPIREEDDEHCRPTELPLTSTLVKQPGLLDDAGRGYRHRRRSESSALSRPVSAFSSVPFRANAQHQPSEGSPDAEMSALPTSTPNGKNNSNLRSLVATCGPEDHYVPTTTAVTTTATASNQFYSQQVGRQTASFTTSNFSLSSLGASMRDSRHMLDVVRGAFELQGYYQRRSGSTTAQSVTDGHSVDGLSGHTSVSASARSLTALFENFPLRSSYVGGDFPGQSSNPRWSQVNSNMACGLRAGSSNPADGEQPSSAGPSSLAHQPPCVNEILNYSRQPIGQPPTQPVHNSASLNGPIKTSPRKFAVVSHIRPGVAVVKKPPDASDLIRDNQSDSDDNKSDPPSPLPVKCRFFSLKCGLMPQLPRLFHKSHSRTLTPTGVESQPTICREQLVDPKATDNRTASLAASARHLSPSSSHQPAPNPRPTACLVVFDKDGDLNVLPAGDRPVMSISPQNVDNNNNCSPDSSAPDRAHRVFPVKQPHSRFKCCILS